MLTVMGHSKSIALTHTLVLSHLHNVKTEWREHRCLATTHVVSTCSMHRYVVFGLDFLTITFFLFFMTRHSKRSFSPSLLQIEPPFSLSLSFRFFFVLAFLFNRISDDGSTNGLFLDRCISCRSST